MSNRILITGGTGFLGRYLARSLTSQGHTVFLGARNNEQNRIASMATGCDSFPLDVASIESTRDAICKIRPELIIHAAATKYVDLSEREPHECVDVNILGSQNVARVAVEAGVSKVLAISTDKAAAPTTTIYGQSKAIMERLFCLLHGSTETEFAAVRFGNIAWSTGSVFPIWKEMMMKDGVIKSTGPHMRRYFFGVDDAVRLVETAICNFSLVGGKVLTVDMGATQMSEILDVWKKVHGTDWQKTAARDGDSIDQYLVGESELQHTTKVNLNDQLHYLLDFRKTDCTDLDRSLNSANARGLSDSEIEKLLLEPLE